MTRREFARGLAGAVGAAWTHGRWDLLAGQARVGVNGDRLNTHLAELSAFGKNPYGGVTRLAYSAADRLGREYVTGLMRAAGLEVRVDAAGNILGRRAGTDPSRMPLLFGSHIDSVPDGGNYDGDVGSLAAIEVAQTIAERSIRLRHPIEVVVFQNEEGGTVGSRAMAGQLEPAALTLTARSGRVTRDGIAFIGGDPDKLDSAVRKRGDIAAYVELHIEQGGTLEEKKIDIGVVLGIVGIGWWDVTVEGFANHAGTTPMDKRQDALLAAARFIEMVNRVVTSEPGRQVGTVGRIQALPGAPNVIPGNVVCSLELRDLDPLKIERLYQRVREEAQRIATASKTTISFAETHRSVPALTDPRVQALIENAALDRGLTSTRLPSGAGHDAQYVAQIAPAGMIFVPSVGGISHSPKEFTKPQDIVNGANVLLDTIQRLDAADWT
ncbi:MAG TPA: Zn-dependent hydrolase [Vicinamibacterales bacterium]|nr:Zn-dependent hydrolase [Vicinamibacterales bacterium]